jgi:hypothetical protein
VKLILARETIGVLVGVGDGFVGEEELFEEVRSMKSWEQKITRTKCK